MRDKAKRARKKTAGPTAESDGTSTVPLGRASPAATVATFAGKATDLEALRTAVVDAAGVGAGLWLSYLSVLSYLAITTGSVTHRDLFFEDPLSLPLLNVKLPITAFFVLGPLLLLIVHTYVLLHFVLLAGKVGFFHAELSRQISDDDRRRRVYTYRLPDESPNLTPRKQSAIGFCVAQELLKPLSLAVTIRAVIASFR